MTAPHDPFAPLSQEEVADTKATAKPKSEKVPIVPVPADAPALRFRHPEYGAPVRTWAYRDGSGQLLGYDGRFEWIEDDQPRKAVLPLAYCKQGDRTGWRQKTLPTPRALYGLHLLAERPNAPVVIAEGAKSADAAGTLLPSHVPVSWQGGANATGQSSWLPLKGRDVLIWPDRDRQRELDGSERPYEDQPGTIAAENIIERLRPFAASISVLDLSEFECADGWDADDAVQNGWTPAKAAEFVAEHSRPVDGDAPGTTMPFRYEHGTDGLYYVESESLRLRVVGRIKVLAKTRDPGGGSWGLLLEWRDDDGRTHRWAMPKAMLAGDGGAVREGLLERGLFVSTEPKARARLLEFLSTVDTPVRARAVSRVGWAGGAFALPHQTIGDTPTERVIFQHPDAGPHQYEAAGTIEEWQEHVARPAIGNSRLVFMISAAFVGPVLTPACEEGGGINIVGASSTGKTSGLNAAASVWGAPQFVRTWRATGNGLEGVAAQHSETLLCLDELGQLEPREAGQVAYMLGNGQGKQRAGRTGSSRATTTWKILYLSTGEIGLADLAREGRQPRTPQAGQEVRILDVPADAGKGMGLFEQLNGAATPEAFSRQIKSAAAEYYGTASLTYLAELAAVRDGIGDIIAKSLARFSAQFVPSGSDGQVLRAARRFGLVAAAGELAVALGVLPWPRDEAFGAAGVMFMAWLARRGGNGSAEDRNILERLRSFIETNGDARFAPLVAIDGELQRPVINRAGFYRSAIVGEETVREFLILPEPFKEIFAGLDLAHVRKLLLDRGIITPDRAGKNQQAISVPGLGKKRCYVVSVARLDDD